MNILAIDTATENCSAALLVAGEVLERERLMERGHAAHILDMVDQLLAQAGITLTGLAAIVFGRGPGGFTGVRLAASVTQGLAFGAGLPVVPVSDLRALAQRALEACPQASGALACNDARMREVYWGCFERGPDDLAREITPERVTPPQQVVLPDTWRDPGRIVGAGSGFAAYSEALSGTSAQLGVVRADLLPRAREMLRLAVPEVIAGRMMDPELALPVYLRDQVARPGG